MSGLEHIVPLLPCYNSRPLEEYFSLAQQLRLKGKQLAVVGEELEAYIALRQFRDLATSMQQHNGYNMPQYRGLKYSLHRELAACDKQLAALSANILGGQRPRLEPSRIKAVVLPADLIPTFVNAARANTTRNTETLGILGGRPHGDSYEIQGLVIPAQRGASDTCECTDDPSLFSALDSRGWMAVGWIHTHPGHGLFLSSVDMHTQALYQQQLPEAIAIVISQREGAGIFHLSAQGLQEISACQARGFHQHTEGLTQRAPVREAGKTQLVDLRI